MTCISLSYSFDRELTVIVIMLLRLRATPRLILILEIGLYFCHPWFSFYELGYGWRFVQAPKLRGGVTITPGLAFMSNPFANLMFFAF